MENSKFSKYLEMEMEVGSWKLEKTALGWTYLLNSLILLNLFTTSGRCTLTFLTSPHLTSLITLLRLPLKFALL